MMIAVVIVALLMSALLFIVNLSGNKSIGWAFIMLICIIVNTINLCNLLFFK